MLHERWLPARATLWTLALVVGACGRDGGPPAEPTLSATAMVDEPAGSPARRQVAGLLELLRAADELPVPGGPIALGCDRDPEITYQTVCGRAVVATAHFAWASCPAPVGPPPPQGGPGPGPGGGPGPGPGDGLDQASTGTVDVTRSITTDATGACTEATVLQVTEAVTFTLERGGPDGQRLGLSGSSTASSTHSRDAAPTSRAVTLDTTHTVSAADGTLEHRLELSGEIQVTLDRASQPPVRVSEGTLNVARDQDERSTLSLSGVVRPPPPGCPWPIAGSVRQVGQDGRAHELGFGSECGQARFDGEALRLDPLGPPGPGPNPGPEPDPGSDAASP
jgi:hypothetical protein